MRRFLTVSLGSMLAIGITFFLPYGTWAEIGSLPAHPLIVHSVVILLPIISLVMIYGFFRRDFFKRFHISLILISALITISVLAAKSSGESLSAGVGLPEFHAEWGNNLVPLAMALFATLVIFAFFSIYNGKKALSSATGFVMIILAVGSIAMTYIVGHSGAESVWKTRYEFVKSAQGSDSGLISIEEVRLHNKSEDCWTVVGKKVYDVTSFVNRHPAGSAAIKEMCGKNASEDFLGEHAGQREPEMWLEKLVIGRLKP